MLLGGEPGAGKSAALSVLVATAALDPSVRLWLLDGKLVELSAWAPCAQRLAGPDVGEAIELLRELRGEMEQRYRELLATGARKISARTACRCTCWRATSWRSISRRGPQERSAFAELLRDLVARGRAAGVIVCAATQKPAADVVPSALRDLFGFRLALRCNTPTRRTRSSAGLGDWGITPPRSRPGSAASGCCWPRTACRSACAGFTSPTRTCGDRARARARCAPMRGWRRRRGAGGVSGSAGTTAMCVGACAITMIRPRLRSWSGATASRSDSSCASTGGRSAAAPRP